MDIKSSAAGRSNFFPFTFPLGPEPFICILTLHFKTIMQFKLVALLTLVSGPVNGAVLSKRSGELRYTFSIVSSGPDA